MNNEPQKKQFLARIKYDKLPTPVTEHRIYIQGKIKGERPHRIDFAWLDVMLAVEIEGGVYSGGRHVRGKGYIHDMLKYNWISKNGWTLLRYTWQSINYEEIKEVYLSKRKKENGNIART